MPSELSTFSIEQLEQSMDKKIGQAHRQQQRNVRIKPLVESMVRWNKENCIHIYNVGPWQWQRNMGSWGYVTIPRCPDDAPYAEMLPSVPGMFHEDINEGEGRYSKEAIDGMYVALQIVGAGSHMSKSNSWIPMGVFLGSEIGPSGKPTADELQGAKTALFRHYAELFEEAESAIRAGGRMPDIVIGEHHRLAALKLGRNDVSWMKPLNPVQRAECPACGTPANVGIMLCPQCRYVINQERYDEAVLQGRIENQARLAFLKGEPKEDGRRKRERE